MKHILPILTVTTLAAAASAQAAAPAAAGLNYNRVGLGYNTDTKGYSLSATAVLGASNFFVGASTNIGGAGTANGTKDAVAIGYLFANVYSGIDATVAVASNEAYALGLRKALGIYNLEAAASFGRNASRNNVWSAELAYNVNKQIQLAVGYANEQGPATGTTDLTVRYNF